jgi:hypothetical protein
MAAQPESDRPVSYLDLIKTGQFKLKSVDPATRENRPPPPPAETDPTELSVAELLQRMAGIRDDIQGSTGSPEAESSDSTSW